MAGSGVEHGALRDREAGFSHYAMSSHVLQRWKHKKNSPTNVQHVLQE